MRYSFHRTSVSAQLLFPHPTLSLRRRGEGSRNSSMGASSGCHTATLGLLDFSRVRAAMIDRVLQKASL